MHRHERKYNTIVEAMEKFHSLVNMWFDKIVLVTIVDKRVSRVFLYDWACIKDRYDFYMWSEISEYIHLLLFIVYVDV